MDNLGNIKARVFSDFNPNSAYNAEPRPAHPKQWITAACPDRAQTDSAQDDVGEFVAQHGRLRLLSMRIFRDFYPGFTDPATLLALADAEGRLICWHSSPAELGMTIPDLELRTGTVLNEARCGSSIVMLALRHQQAMVSTCPVLPHAPFGSRAMMAVPLLNADQTVAGCVAIFNTSESSLGEKLLLAKLIAREVARTQSEFVGLPVMTVSPVVEPFRAAAPAPVSDFMERRQGDRRQRTQTSTAGVKLTRRQIEVLKLFAQGKGYKEIAREIGITSYKTVEEHLDAVRQKLDVSHRRECIQKAMSLGLI